MKKYAIASVENVVPKRGGMHGYIALLDVTNSDAPVPVDEFHFFQNPNAMKTMTLRRYQGARCWPISKVAEFCHHILSEDENFVRSVFEKWHAAAKHLDKQAPEFEESDDLSDMFNTHLNNCRAGRNTILRFFGYEVTDSMSSASGADAHFDDLMNGFENPLVLAA